MKIAVDNGLENVEVVVPFTGIPSEDNIKAIILHDGKSFMEKLAGAIVDEVRNQSLLDTVFDAVVGADVETVVKYFVAVGHGRVWVDSWGQSHVPCIFDGKGLIVELLGESMYDRLLIRDDCPYV